MTEKKCITKFGVVRGSEGSSGGAVCLEHSWTRSRGPVPLGTVTKLAFPWEDPPRRNLFALLLLYQVPAIEILSVNQSHQVLGSQSFIQLTIFGIQIIITIFSVTQFLLFPKQENQPKNKRTIFPQTLIASRVDAIFLLARPLGGIRYLGAWPMCLFRLK